ncbi:hypothetical protein M3Y98_00423100 [Aphelenchoides besseyi]|nr:hypothetical protein M3Y98_00423100 [Aphelenchoides besseyi]
MLYLMTWNFRARTSVFQSLLMETSGASVLRKTRNLRSYVTISYNVFRVLLIVGISILRKLHADNEFEKYDSNEVLSWSITGAIIFNGVLCGLSHLAATSHVFIHTCIVGNEFIILAEDLRSDSNSCQLPVIKHYVSGLWVNLQLCFSFVQLFYIVSIIDIFMSWPELAINLILLLDSLITSLMHALLIAKLHYSFDALPQSILNLAVSGKLLDEGFDVFASAVDLLFAMIISKVFEESSESKNPHYTNLLDFIDETTFYYSITFYYTMKSDNLTQFLWKTTMIRVEGDTFPIEPKVMGTLDCKIENGKLSPCGQYFYSLGTAGTEDFEEYVFRKIHVETLELTTYRFSKKLSIDTHHIPPVRFYFTSSYNLMLINVFPDEPFSQVYQKISIERTHAYKFEFDEIPDLPYKFESLHENEHTLHWAFDVVDDPLFFFNEHIDGSVYTLDYENDTKWVKNTVEGPKTDPWDVGCSRKIYNGNGIMSIEGYGFNDLGDSKATKCYQLIFDRANHRCRNQFQKGMSSRQRRRLSSADLNSHVKRYVSYEEANILLRQLLPQANSDNSNC